MVRVREIKEKFHPNQKFRAWKASHTFGGTTKTKSLYILGFRRKNFYYVAAATGAILLIAAIAGGVGFRASMRKAKVIGAQEEAMGQLMETQVTERRTRTISSGGRTFLTTEVTSFETTVQRGGGATLVEATGENGQRITVPGFKTYVPNSDGGMDLKTLLGSTIAVTNADGGTISTVLFGRPTAITDGNGDVSTGTIFPGLTVVTGSDGSVATSLSIASPASPVASTSVGDSTTTIGGAASTGKSTSEVSTKDTMFENPPSHSVQFSENWKLTYSDIQELFQDIRRWLFEFNFACCIFLLSLLLSCKYFLRRWRWRRRRRRRTL